jgi:anti-anti-sigma factor
MPVAPSSTNRAWDSTLVRAPLAVRAIPQPQVLQMPILLSVQQGLEFKATVQAHLDQVRVDASLSRTLRLDFSDTVFMDSSGIGALINCRKMTQKAEVTLSLRNLSPQVRTVLQLTDLDRMFTIEDSALLASALGSQVPGHPVKLETSPSAISSVMTHPSVHSRAKRWLDVAGAIVGLVITVVLSVPIAIAIKLEDGGPIFFQQTRCSWLGRPFQIWKFRSMAIDAEHRKGEVENEADGAIFKNSNDPRITRVGRFLRRTSLDELPQFWNVLQGEMSLVGTRPPTLDEVERYEIPQWRRLDIKPGMTGEWQVHGRSSVTNFEDIVALDLRYQENWSIFYDLQLIFQTIGVVLSKKSNAC